MTLPKQPLITLSATVSAILVGLILGSHLITAKPTVTLHPSSITILSDPAPADPVTTDPTTPPADSTQPAAPANTQTTNTSTQTDTTPPPDTPATVVAVSATVTDWGNPEPTTSLWSVDGTPLPTVVQHRYCVWTYSDDSTQQQLYASKYSTVNGTASTIVDPTFDCTVATAP
jgi:hypothetical protein